MTSDVVKIFNTAESIEAQRRLWNEMDWLPLADIDFYLSVAEVRPEVLRPVVLLMLGHRGNKIMAACRVEKRMMLCSIGYKVVYQTQLTQLTVAYIGTTGNVDYTTAAAFVSTLQRFMENQGLDAVNFDALPVASPLHEAARKEPIWLCRDYVSPVALHWTMTVPRTLDEFFSRLSTKARHELRRQIRNLEKRYPERVQYVLLRDESEVDRLCRDAEFIVGKTYHRGLGVGFTDSKEVRLGTTLFARKHRLLAYMLYIEGRPSAFWMGTIYGNTLRLAYTGYDPLLEKMGIGTILFVKMVENLCQSFPQVGVIDFGMGDAWYKRRFGDRSCEETSSFIFSTSLRSIRANCIRTLIIGLSRSLLTLMKKTNLESRIKKYWRRALAEGPRESTNG